MYGHAVHGDTALETVNPSVAEDDRLCQYILSGNGSGLEELCYTTAHRKDLFETDRRSELTTQVSWVKPAHEFASTGHQKSRVSNGEHSSVAWPIRNTRRLQQSEDCASHSERLSLDADSEEVGT